MDTRLSPEAAFSHPFIAKAVNELKCLRQGGDGKPGTAQGKDADSKMPSAGSGAPPSNNSNNIKNNATGGYSNGSTHSNQQNSAAPNSARSHQSDNQSLPRIR